MAELKSMLNELEERMDKTVDFMKDEFATIRAGRANPHVLDRLTVDYYGTPTPLQQVGNISVPEARMILIQPWDKSLLKAIEVEGKADCRSGEEQTVKAVQHTSVPGYQRPVILYLVISLDCGRREISDLRDQRTDCTGKEAGKARVQ